MSQSVEHAMMLHGQGRLGDAEQVYRSVLAKNPRELDALRMLALLRLQQRNLREAHELIVRAVKVAPRSSQALSVLMAVLLELDRSEEALDVCDRILALDPHDLDTLYNRGVLLSRLRRFEEALAVYDKVLLRSPGLVDALFNRGNILAELGRYDAAVTCYDTVLTAAPGHGGALTNRGNACLTLGRLEEATASYDKVLAISPHDVNALANRAVALKDLGRYDEAMASCERALAFAPGAVGALVTRGNILIGLARNEEAIASFQKALTVNSGDVDALNSLGVALTNVQRYAEALAGFEQALAINSSHAGVLDNRGVALFAIGRWQDALASYDRSLAAAPDSAETLYHRGHALAALGRYDEAIIAWERALTLDPRHSHALGALAFYQLMVCNWQETARIATELGRVLEDGRVVIEPFTLLAYSVSPADHLRHTRRYVQSRRPPISPVARTRDTASPGKIRVAYLSSSFHRHPTAWQIAELFELHDRSRFEVHGISYGPDDGSEIRARLAGTFDHFHDVRLRTDREVAQLLADTGVQIAVDLKGHTEQARPWILAHRPAPIQVSYFGYTATMGVDFIDYIMADPVVLPADQQEHYDERIVHLPVSYWVNDSRRQVAEDLPSRRSLGLPDEGFVFCCFNNSYKLTPPVFEVWMRLLREVDGSVLWLLETSEIAMRNLRQEASARGVEPTRLVFAPKMEISRHVARHRVADLFLDNLPVNAHTAASDALWVGLPVLTCIGESFIGRVAASLLMAAGAPELVTHSLEQYEATALRLANDPTLLASIRKKLADRPEASLFDTRRLCRHIEKTYATMWDFHQRGERPRGFAVDVS